HEEELAPLEVMDDVHALQDRARAGLPVAAAAGDHQELFDRGLLDGLRDRELEVPAQVADGLLLDELHRAPVGAVLGAELLRAEELPRFFFVLEVETVPVDDRLAAQRQSNGLEIDEREVVETLQPIDSVHDARIARRATKRP